MWMPDLSLINEYEMTYRAASISKKELDNKLDKIQKKIDLGDASIEDLELITVYQVEKRTYSGIMSDLIYAIDWLKRGSEPIPRRSISNRSYEQRTQYFGDIDIAVSMENKKHPENSIMIFDMVNELDTNLPEGSLTYIYRYLETILSEKELESVTDIYGNAHTYQDTSELMGVTRGTVQTCINRAKKKLEDKLTSCYRNPLLLQLKNIVNIYKGDQPKDIQKVLEYARTLINNHREDFKLQLGKKDFEFIWTLFNTLYIVDELGFLIIDSLNADNLKNIKRIATKVSKKIKNEPDNSLLNQLIQYL